jgi:fructose-specific component phosphotransferase system IIB-like protein
MRIGVTSIFSFRPHVEHVAYLARLLADAGHEIYGLTCDGALSHCYGRLLRQRSKLGECPRCMLGGIRTFPIPRVSSIDARLRRPLDGSRLWRLVVSSVAVRYRTESTDYLATPPFLAAVEQLAEPVETAYANAMRWIELNRLGAVILFNGRMDVLAGVVAACEDLGVPYISIERPWLAHGIYMIPNGNVLDLRAKDIMCAAFRDKPLLEGQVLEAGSIAVRNFLGQNRLLWRVYNTERSRTSWPLSSSGERVLILPSSRNEFEGHPDWVCPWGEFTVGFDQLLDHLGISSSQCVLRCHPNWAERIGTFTGKRSEEHYTNWCRRRGIHVIPSAGKENTYDLIAAADLVVVNGSSTGIEAALHGKRVILVGHSPYQQAGLSSAITTPAELASFSLPAEHSPEAVVIKALRFLYCAASRFPQYVAFVRAVSNTRCEYFAGADPERVMSMIHTGTVEPDDSAVADDDHHERRVAAHLLAGEWESLQRNPARPVPGVRLAIRRRAGLRWIDELRDLMPRGDA